MSDRANCQRYALAYLEFTEAQRKLKDSQERMEAEKAGALEFLTENGPLTVRVLNTDKVVTLVPRGGRTPNIEATVSKLEDE